jgi:hypothetical protein
VGSVLRDATSWMENDEDLQEIRFIRDDLIHPLCICTTIEDGIGCQKLGLRV